MENNDFSNANLTGLSNELFELNTKWYCQNLKSKLKNFKTNSILLIKGGKEVPRYDTDTVFYHFIQDSNFYYLTGVTDPNFVAYIDFNNESITLFMETPTEREKIFSKIPSLEDVEKRYNKKCVALESLYTTIKLRNPEKIYLLAGVNSDSNNIVQTFDFNPPKDLSYLLNIIDKSEIIYEILADCRTVKQIKEIDFMQFIAYNCAEIHKFIISSSIIKPGMNERDIENSFKKEGRKRFFCRETSFPSICCSGINNKYINYQINNEVLTQNSLITMEMGIKIAGYNSDLTSTVPINGKFSDKQKNIYNIVLNTNRSIMSSIKPGVSWLTVHLQAERLIIEGLKALKILNPEYSTDLMLSNRVSAYFMPHGIGHFIGLERHDVGGYLSFTPPKQPDFGLNSLRTVRLISTGNILTVEPGIYFNPYLLTKAFDDINISKYFNKDMIKKDYFNFGGVRIEDIILVGKYGCINLSFNLPRTVEEIESLMMNKLIQL